MATRKKYHDHNGKEKIIANGRNVRLTENGHSIIAQYCRDEMLKMGAFVEKCALDKIPSTYKQQSKK